MVVKAKKGRCIILELERAQGKSVLCKHKEQSSHPHEEQCSHPHKDHCSHPHKERCSHPHKDHCSHPHKKQSSHPHKDHSSHPHKEQCSHPQKQHRKSRQDSPVAPVVRDGARRIPGAWWPACLAKSPSSQPATELTCPNQVEKQHPAFLPRVAPPSSAQHRAAARMWVTRPPAHG